jgi:HlyD family secretion protein
VVELDKRVLAFELPGRVVEVPVARGATVHAGELLARVDDTLERAAHATREAEAEAASAQVALLRAGSRPEDVRAMAAQIRAAKASEELLARQLARQKTLFDGGAVPEASVDELESRHRAAVAERQALEQRLAELRHGARAEEVQGAEARATAAAKGVELETARVERHELRAVGDGTVLDVHVDPGEMVGAGTPVVTIADTHHPYADVFVPEGELGGVRVGAPARVHVDSIAEPIPGHVEDVGRRTEFTPRYLFSERERPNLVVRVRVRIDDAGERLHAGVPAFVAIDKDASPTAPAASSAETSTR